jgi:hypothetical protein
MVRMPTLAFMLALATALSGCLTSPPPSRGGTGAQSLISETSTGYNVQQINVVVPRSLRVSEANTIKPNADIVWHGDALGDRHAQVAKILQDAIVLGTAGYRSGLGIVIDVQLVRFHALTPRTRATYGGQHELVYLLTIRDSETGEMIVRAREVDATFHASGGAQAMAEEAAGRSQVVVIREALVRSIQRELGNASPMQKEPLIGQSTTEPVTLITNLGQNPIAGVLQ